MGWGKKCTSTTRKPHRYDLNQQNMITPQSCLGYSNNTSLYDAPVVEVSSLSQWPSFMADWPLTTVPVVHCKTKKYCRNSPNCKPQQEWSNYKIQQKFLNAAVLSSMFIHEKPHPAHGLLSIVQYKCINYFCVLSFHMRRWTLQGCQSSTHKGEMQDLKVPPPVWSMA